MSITVYDWDTVPKDIKGICYDLELHFWDRERALFVSEGDSVFEEDMANMLCNKGGDGKYIEKDGKIYGVLYSF